MTGTDDVSSMLPRRAVLGGAAAIAGAAVGATATGLLVAHDNDTTSSPNVPSAAEALMTDHGVLKRILLAYRTIVARLDTGASVRSGVITDATQIIGDYIEGFHEGLEEGYVFPRIAQAQPQLVRTLLVQHDRGRHITARVQGAAGGDLSARSVRAAIATDLNAFVRMYEPHEAWEDTVVFPQLRRGTPQRELDLLAERFHDLESEQYGDHALSQLLDRIVGIEQQLGTADLATFTPALQ